MDDIISMLSEIEAAASAIIEHAENQKSVLEKEWQAKRDHFDRQLEEQTQQKLLSIQEDLNTRTDEALQSQKKDTEHFIQSLQQEYQQKHTAYAKEIVKHIIEV